jgi:hypothetical protein
VRKNLLELLDAGNLLRNVYGHVKGIHPTLTRTGEPGICDKGPTKSGVTSLAGFAGYRLPQARGIRIAIPAALR